MFFMPKEIHAAVNMEALKSGRGMYKWLLDAVVEKLERNHYQVVGIRVCPTCEQPVLIEKKDTVGVYYNCKRCDAGFRNPKILWTCRKKGK